MTQDFCHDNLIGEGIVTKISQLTSGFLNFAQEINDIVFTCHCDVKKPLLHVMNAFMRMLIMHLGQLLLYGFGGFAAHDIF